VPVTVIFIVMAGVLIVPSISKSWKVLYNPATLQRLVIEALPLQELITHYNALQLVVCYRNSKNGRLIYSDIMRYNAL